MNQLLPAQIVMRTRNPDIVIFEWEIFAWMMWLCGCAHPCRSPTDSSVGLLSIPGRPRAPSLLAAPQLLQQ